MPNIKIGHFTLTTEAANKLGVTADETDLESKSWQELLQLRRETTDPAEQERIAPYEHRAYAREAVSSNPALAPIFALLVPGYQAAKATGIVEARTEPSLEQLQEGFKGIYEGLVQR